MKSYESQSQEFSTIGDKMLQHCEVLNSIQNKKKWKPITFQLCPTGTCNFNCHFCSVKNRDKTLSLKLEDIYKALKDFKKLGAKALEMSLKGDELIPIRENNELKLKTIKEVVNDKSETSFTLNDENRFQEGQITDFIEHKQTEPLYKITLDDGRNITVTKSHSIFFYENNEIVYKPVSDAKIGDTVILLSKKPEIIEKDLGDDFSRLLGYFVAEGSYSWQRDKVPHGIHFTFAENEKYVDDVVKILEKLGHKSSVYNYGNSKTHIAVFSKELCKKLLSFNIGRYANQKRVPDIILNSTYNNKMEFLKGLFAGDGNFRNTKIKKWNRHSLHLKTSSKIMSQSLGYLLDLMDIWYTINQGKNGKRFIGERELPETDYYSINIENREDLEKVKDVVEFMGSELNYTNSKYSCHNRKRKRIEINQDCFGIKIKKIEEVNKEEKVYDLSVKDTHRFEGSFRIVCHNTGGGNPLLYPYVNEVIERAYKLGFDIGLISNSLNPGQYLKPESANKLTWYRASLSAFDNFENFNWKQYNFDIIPQGILGFSYIINKKTTEEKIKKIYELVKSRSDVKFVRIAPNCLEPDSIKTFKKKWSPIIEKIDNTGKFFLKEIEERYLPYPYFCAVGMIRPYVCEDGYVYSCSSFLLRKRKLEPEWRIGHITDIKGMYKECNKRYRETGKPYDVPIDKCFHCMLPDNNKFLHNVCREMTDRNFA